MTDGTSLRTVTLEDAAEICGIYGPYVLNSVSTFEMEPPSAEEMRRRIAVTLDAGYPYFVAELDGKVIGYAYAGAYKARPAYRFTVENSVYVAENTRKSGVGSLLMQRLIEQCELQGFRQMLAVITYVDGSSSIKLHEKFGFIEEGRVASLGYKFGEWHDILFMRRALGAGNSSAPSELK